MGETQTGSPLDRLEREAASAGPDAKVVDVLAGDYTDCGGKLAADIPHGKMVAVPAADLKAVICPTPEPKPKPVAKAAEPEKTEAKPVKSRVKRSSK